MVPRPVPALLLYKLSLAPSTSRLARAFTTTAPPFSAGVAITPKSFYSLAAKGGKGNSGNLLANIFGDMASSLLSSGSEKGGTNSKLDSALKDSFDISWLDIGNDLEAKQTPDERMFRANVEKGVGPASPLHKIRLFDESNKEEDIRVTLYRDHASWCPYCQKVWMTLEEKRIPYRIEKINMSCYGKKPPSFLKIQPGGQIPVAIIDGTVYNQSNDIMYALEQIFPDHKPLVPTGNERMRSMTLLKLERTLFSAWMSWLTGGWDQDGSKAKFMTVLRDVEAELSDSKDGDFFLGKDVSIVDMMFAPFLERMVASLLFFKGYQIRVCAGQDTEFVAVNKWFNAMEKLESYQLTKGDYYSHNWDLPPQLGGCTYQDDGKPFELAINGEMSINGRRGTWELPLEPHNGGVEKDWDWCGDEEAARREATERLVFNHENIVMFSSRGAGQKGMPPYMAALSDPNAVPNEAVASSIDSCLRLVSLALLKGSDNMNDEMQKISSAILNEGGSQFAGDVVSSLAYLRDRVGVPRDMRLPAARQLRAHLNWSIGTILSAIDES